MDKRELTVIENTKIVDESHENKLKAGHQTNPIVKKLTRFHFEKPETFSVKDLFKK